MNSTIKANTPNGPRHLAGFTLVELMVAVLVMAILSAIAIPGYSSYVRKSRRTEAKSALLDLAGLEERFFSANNIYTNSPSSLGYSGAAFPLPVGSGYYQVNIPAPTAAALGPPATTAAYTITATPQGDQAKDTQCAAFTVTSTGQQTSVDSSNNDSTTTCWR